MPKMIDLADVEAGMEEFRIRERSKTERPGMDGIVARAQLAALPAAALSGEIMSVCSDDRNEQFKVVNRLLQALAEEIASILTGQAQVIASRHEFKEAGRA